MTAENNIAYKKDSYRGGVAITPHDTNDLTDPVSALYIGTAGSLKVITASGETVAFANVAIGLLPLACTRVYNTDTAAAGIVGLK
jgi:hypothetical protein